MKPTSFFWVVIVAASLKGTASLSQTPLQQKTIQQLQGATPQQMEAYKKEQIRIAKQQAKSLGIVLDLPFEEGINGGTVPAKNIKALARAATTSPDRQTLLLLLNRLSTNLRARLVPSVKVKVLQTLQAEKAPVLASYAASLWYTGRQEAALLMQIGAIQKEPAQALFWNNLGAYCNLSGLEAIAIPVMKYCLQLTPKSSMALNNLGQAYLGLGDQALSRKALMERLQLDSLNPEANRSMALLCLQTGDTRQAIYHFSAELRVAYRNTSIALIKNTGLEDSIRYADIFRKGSARNFSFPSQNVANPTVDVAPTHGPSADWDPEFGYEESSVQPVQTSAFHGLSLSRIELPPFPKTVRQADSLRPLHRGFIEKAKEEMAFYMNLATQLPERKRYDLRHQVMMYGNYVEMTASALQSDELPNLTLATLEWEQFVVDWTKQYHLAIEQIDKDATSRSVEALCELKRRVGDDFASRLSNYLEGRHHILNTRHKIYIDRIGQLAGLDPTASGYVYTAVVNYLAYLVNISDELSNLATLEHCNGVSDAITPPGWDLNHLFELMCEKGLGGSLPFGVLEAKLDCEAFSISGSAELIEFGIEKKFATGTSTAWISAGLDAEYKDVLAVEATEKIFVVWDKNNVCTDAGVSGTGKIAIEKVGSSEFGYSFGVSSGFEAAFTNENELSGNLSQVIDFL